MYNVYIIYICVFVYVFMYICIYVYTYIYIYITLIPVNQYLRHNLGCKKYKLFDVANFISVLPTFGVINLASHHMMKLCAIAIKTVKISCTYSKGGDLY